MTDNINRFSMTIFDYDDFSLFSEVIEDICKNEINSLKAVISNEYFNVETYVNRVTIGLPQRFTCWTSSNYPAKIFFMSNLDDGWFTMVNCIQNRLHCNCFYFYFVDRSNNDDIGAFFQYSNVNEGYVRTVYAIKEFKWVFYEHGLPAYFEDLNNYKARCIKDRLNSRIIINYLEKQGINLLDVDIDITNSISYIQTSW